MSQYSGWIAWSFFSGMIGFVIFLILKGYLLYIIIKKAPVYTKAKIVSYLPKTPDKMGEVDIVMTYSFIADEKTYIKEQQALNIKTLDLDKYYVGKEVPIVYYRKNPNYSKIDVYDESLRK